MLGAVYGLFAPLPFILGLAGTAYLPVKILGFPTYGTYILILLLLYIISGNLRAMQVESTASVVALMINGLLWASVAGFVQKRRFGAIGLMAAILCLIVLFIISFLL